jgi:solute carrier family 25 carnitine/acylcarnitine transporter 20/29
MSSPLVGVALINSALFAVYGSTLKIISKDPTYPSIIEIFNAGILSGFVNSFVSTPIELVKIRLQNQTAHCDYKGPIDW